MKVFKPNKMTLEAVAHPLRFAVQSGFSAAFLTFAGLVVSFGPATGLLVAAGAFVLVVVVSLWLWRPAGPGSRWYERARADGDVR